MTLFSIIIYVLSAIALVTLCIFLVISPIKRLFKRLFKHTVKSAALAVRDVIMFICCIILLLALIFFIVCVFLGARDGIMNLTSVSILG